MLNGKEAILEKMVISKEANIAKLKDAPPDLVKQFRDSRHA